MSLLLTYYGDDFTGSTDALEQLTLAGIRTALFIQPPTRAQLRRFKNVQAVGVAGITRSMSPDAMERELRPAFKKLKALGAPHIHYKVCSTFDSSPKIGSIGRLIDVGMDIFRGPFVPLLVAAPALGRHCVFGNLFARFGIGSNGDIHRLDRHPSISKHPVTPMTEADLRLHLGKQTRKSVALFDILKLALPWKDVRAALNEVLASKPDVVLFDCLYQEQLQLIGRLIDNYANQTRPLFSIGSSGIEMALGAHWNKQRQRPGHVSPASQILVGSGSCSPVSAGQISWAMKSGFAEVHLDVESLTDTEVKRAIHSATELLKKGKNVIVHTTPKGTPVKSRNSKTLGGALGTILRGALTASKVPRICIAGGDTSGHAARALGIEALEMIASLTPGAPLCRAHAPRSPLDGREIVFKGGQVGGEDYFGTVLKGKP